tara:strand:+ start:171 stop:644 length:474 start_codon:yes stop_codon:yes gene_type:complete
MRALIFALVLMITPFVAQAAPSQEQCLALAIYHEAKNQTISGQVAVAMVIMNRKRNNRFPKTVCGVVKQSHFPGKKYKCQFTFFCDGKSDRPVNKTAWLKAKVIANFVYSNYDRLSDPTQGSLWYHADYVTPKWSSKLIRVAQIDDHIFYRQVERQR